MKPSRFVRVLALVVLAGQLQFVPATVACTLRHQEPATHCDEGSRPTGPVVQAFTDTAPLTCAAGGPCAVPGPVVVPLDIAFTLVNPASGMVAVRSADAPPSFSTAPTPPPPQS